MPIWLRNLQSIVRFKEHLLQLQCNFILNLIGASRYDVSVVCMDSLSIRNLNKIYRNVDRATDVLAFPYHEDIITGCLPVVAPDKEHDYNLGDMILGMSVIYEDCVHETVRLEHHLPIIFTHGLCHLLGYQHDTAQHTKIMYEREGDILSSYNNSFGTCIKPLTSFEIQQQ